MGKLSDQPIRNIPTGGEGNMHKNNTALNPRAIANQDEGRAGRQRHGSEELGVKREAFNAHREPDTTKHMGKEVDTDHDGA